MKHWLLHNFTRNLHSNFNCTRTIVEGAVMCHSLMELIITKRTILSRCISSFVISTQWAGDKLLWLLLGIRCTVSPTYYISNKTVKKGEYKVSCIPIKTCCNRQSWHESRLTSSNTNFDIVVVNDNTRCRQTDLASR